MNITLTDNAYEHLRDLRRKHDKEFVRLEVTSGGCAGFEYKWSFADDYTRDDHIIDDRLLVHKMNELYLLGVEIDYDSEIFGSTFKFNNPQAKSQCGCGTSFSI